MNLDFSESGVMKVDVFDYVIDMVKDSPGNLPKKKVMCPWMDKSFRIDDNSKPLNEKCRKIFHMFVMKAMFVCKCARQDTNQVFVSWQPMYGKQLSKIGQSW